MSIDDIARQLIAKAEERFGRERTEELRSEIERMAAQLHKLDAATVDFEDAP